ncbi:SEL1-like repeat protein [Citrobacter sedlakii]|uniref:SEL1-like repeat protein n=2 Tax=Citrobacter TaxID=544 RepID=UPI00388EB9F8
MLTCLLLAACDQTAVAPASHKPAVDPLPTINTRLAFTCKHENIPQPSVESEVLFKYARWLQKNNQLKEDVKVDAEIERLYRIAAENGHYRANINLQNGAMRGHFHLSGAERLRMSQALIDAGVASGYYFVAIYLQHGAAGLQQDDEMALRYYRKAADEGNAQAQAYVGDKLAPAKMAPDIARQMLRCAAEQGEAEAVNSLGNIYAVEKKYKEAVESFQLGVAAGDESSASFLEHAFESQDSTDRLYYLALEKDPERASRYERIGEILGNYSYAHPVVPEINDIVPLPPVPLPAWDGKLKWLEERKANIPPAKPGESLIAELAKAKQLNPVTGKPLPSSPHFNKDDVALLLCRSGEACPKSGYWQIAWIPYTGISQEEIRYFAEGETMPMDIVERLHPRPWPFTDKRVREERAVEWRLVGEA